MISYQLPKLDFPKPKNLRKGLSKTRWKSLFIPLILVVLVSSLFGFLAGIVSGSYFYREIKNLIESMPEGIEVNNATVTGTYNPITSQEKAIIKVVGEVSPAVVSVIITKEQSVYERYYTPFFEEFFEDPFFEFMVPENRQKGVEKQQVGGGTGFIISSDGMVLTNKHVVLDEDAEYSILTLDNKSFQAEVLAKDPIQDIAVLKIVRDDSDEEFPTVKLGDSDKIEIGQTAIAIGYVLGRYQNAVSVGVVSGLGRTITAGNEDFYETLEDIIQTDAAINKGNSGGPLLNLKGEVIGINTAIDIQGQSIGFSIPINKAKRDIEQVKETGKIVYPFLGIRYIVVNEQIKEERGLSVDHGALIIRSEAGELAISPGSAAEKAGLKEGDIVLEFNEEKITVENSLAKIILEYSPKDSIRLKVLSEGMEKTINVVLGEK